MQVTGHDLDAVRRHSARAAADHYDLTGFPGTVMVRNERCGAQLGNDAAAGRQSHFHDSGTGKFVDERGRRCGQVPFGIQIDCSADTSGPFLSDDFSQTVQTALQGIKHPAARAHAAVQTGHRGEQGVAVRKRRGRSLKGHKTFFDQRAGGIIPAGSARARYKDD